MCQAGLEKYPEWFSFCGAVQLTWPDGKVLDMTPLRDGLQISAADAPLVQISYAPQVRTLLFVENKANYFDTIRKHPSPERVVVFHGGCYSPQRGRFFPAALPGGGTPGSSCSTGGDIDCGGFQMDSRLRREIDPRIRPWRMDVEQLQGHQAQARILLRSIRGKSGTPSARPLFARQPGGPHLYAAASSPAGTGSPAGRVNM